MPKTPMPHPVEIIAHRGYSGRYPENTRRAFEEALALGVECVEFDVHLTQDEQLAVIHDFQVDRTTGGCGSVAELTLPELRALDAGRWKHPDFSGGKIPAFEEALDLLGGQTRLNVHLKTRLETRPRLIERVVRELADRRLLESAYLALACEEEVEIARRCASGVSVCMLQLQPLETYVERARACGCQWIQPGNKVVDAPFVRAAHACRLRVTPFYADDEVEMRRLIECGVDGILTNWPERLRKVRAAGGRAECA